jgi:hypothetical protein
MEPRRRMQLYRTMHLWHWISAAVCFAALTLFTVTGITLNHASAISAEPRVSSGTAQLPENLRGTLATSAPPADAPPADIVAWAEDAFKLSLRDATAEWSEEELYLSAPGQDATRGSRSIAPAAAKFEDGSRLARVLQRPSQAQYRDHLTIFIDVVAAAILFFSLTGLVLLWIQARQRTSTWPLVGGGIALVTALMIFFAH